VLERLSFQKEDQRQSGGTLMANWTKAQEKVLHMLWPASDPEAIQQAFPDHSWQAITCRAAKLGIRRNRRPPASKHHLIQKLYQRRMALGLSQTMLARNIGIDRATLNRLERGKSFPGLLILEDWCEAIGIKIELSESADMANRAVRGNGSEISAVL
jgi:DNA-binding XRE family transcriptional regulator